MSRVSDLPAYWEQTTPLPTVVDGPVGPQCPPPTVVKHAFSIDMSAQLLVEAQERKQARGDGEGDVKPVAAFIGELVEVYESDAVDGALVLVLPGTDEVCREALEISRAEAREIIAGLAALL